METMGAQPVYNVNSEDGMMGGGGMWIFFLFFLLAWGGNGIGGFGGGNATNQITNEFLFNSLDNQVARLNQSLDSGMMNINNGINNLGYNNLSNFKDLSAQYAACCCETNRNIDSIRYENAKNTCDIITNANMNTRDLITTGNANTQRIIDLMNAEKIEALRTELQTCQLQLSQNAQSADLINQLKPCPIPAYVVASPFCCPTTPTI